MRPYAYDALSFLDNSFPHHRSPTNHCMWRSPHLRGGPLRRPDGGHRLAVSATLCLAPST